VRAGGARRTSRRRVPSSAGRRGGGTASPRARRAARWLWGDGDESGERRVGGEGDLESTRGGEDAGAHARHMRRRTSGLRQLTFPPRSISRLSSASSPSSAALYNFSALEGPNQPMCSARCQRRARVGRRAPCHAIGAKLSDPRVPKGAKHAMLREGASTQGPIPCSTRAASRPGSRVGRKGQARTPDEGQR
jgi:hypothetical protein